MLHISLFSGIGGFDLAAQWMGWQNIVSCEINPFCNTVLKHYWPDTYHHTDIKSLTYEAIDKELTAKLGINWRADDIVLSGGFPCQPYSLAGKRKGKDDDRHLWPEMLRVIREVQPRWVVGENVFGIINWDAGLVFDEVQSDMEAEGYEVQPYVLPACAVNAPHRRDRVWFVAYASGNGKAPNRCGAGYAGQGQTTIREADKGRQGEAFQPVGLCCVQRDATNSSNIELQRSEFNGSFGSTGSSEGQSGQLSGSVRSTWDVFPTQSPICGGNDGLPTGLDGITFSKWRNESIKAYGNAVVPQVVFQIFKAIEEYEKIQQQT